MLLKFQIVLRGLILSQYNVAGANFAPVCSPIAYVREQSNAKPDGVSYGEIGSTDPQYERYATVIREIVSKAFVKVALPGNPIPQADKPDRHGNGAQ